MVRVDQLLVDAAVDRIRGEFEQRVGEVVQAAQAEAQRRLDEFTASLPAAEIVVAPPPPAATDARDRARRTALQGVVATLLVAGMTALTGALAAPEFDLTAAADWRVAATSVLTAVVMAGLAFVQRLVNPPKGQ